MRYICDPTYPRLSGSNLAKVVQQLTELENDIVGMDKEPFMSDLSERFTDEELGTHWAVDGNVESFNRLINYIEVKTNFKPYFESALTHIPWDSLGEELVIADIGSGVGWTSALISRMPQVRKVYSIEPGRARARRIQYVAKHFGLDNGQVEWINGSFENFNLPEKVDYVILCASFHHCVDTLQKRLFENIVSNSRRSNVGVLVANEHYVTTFWTLSRMKSYYLKENAASRKQLCWGPGQWREPSPWDNEHHRIKRECDRIFEGNGFNATYYIHPGDLCKNKSLLKTRLMWRYYHAVLERKEI